MTNKNTPTIAGDEMPSVWEARIRWIVGIAVLVFVNFASIAYYAGSYSRDIEANKNKIKEIESDMVTKDQFNEMKEKVKEVSGDVKELLRESKKK